jgi:nucleotide-binding universal stress UspA family protein
MFKRIVVPLDGSLRAERVLPVAARIARASGGRIVLLRVAGIPAEYAPAMYASALSASPFYAQELLEAELAGARYYLAAVAQSEQLAGIRIETTVLSGAAAPTILDVAGGDDGSPVDLIVLCSHGRTGFTHWALGSVAQKVARHSPVPVLILREEDAVLADRLTGAAPPLRALVALDGSRVAEAALVPAAQLVAVLAAPERGALHLAQVVPLPTLRSEQEYQQHDGQIREQALHQATTYLSAVADNLRRSVATGHGLEVTWSVTVNEDVAHTLISMAELGEETGTYEVQRCDLIAMATHGRGGLQRWMLGSITERVLNDTKLPLLIIRPQELNTPANNGQTKEESGTST